MKVFIATYKGKKRWNYSRQKVVIANDAEEAWPLIYDDGQPKEDWELGEKILGQPEVISWDWVGDRG